MAADTTVQLGASFLDSENVKATTSAHMHIDGVASTVTDLATVATDWASAMNLITGAKITEVRAKVIADVPSAAGKPVGGSEVQEAGVFDFSLGATPYHWGLVVPAILETLTATGGKIPPTGDVAALIAYMLAGHLGGGFTGLDTTLLTAFQRSFEGNRTKRRQTFRASVNYTQPA